MNSDKTTKILAGQVLLVFLVLALTAGIVFFLYTKVFKTEVTFISGFNWTEDKITVKVKNESVDVEAGEMFSIQLRTKEKVLVSIYEASGGIIRENIYDIGNKPAIIMELISSQKENECIVKADVTNVYYNINDGVKIQDTVVLKDEATESFIYKYDGKVDLTYLVYPGSYDSGFLPSDIYEHRKVEGLFFVECKNIDNPEDLHADILGSIYYGQEE